MYIGEQCIWLQLYIDMQCVVDGCSSVYDLVV
jgi:hypothetical protein